MASYTERTLDALRERGYVPGKVELFLPHAGEHGMKRDLYGLFDYVAMKRGVELVGVQSTGPNGYSSHLRTFADSEHIDTWLSIPGLRAELWCWELKPQVEGSKVMEWKPRIVLITAELLAEQRAKPRKPSEKPKTKDPGIPRYLP